MATTTHTYTAPANQANALTTELNSLANAAYTAASAAIDNSSTKHLYMAVHLHLGSLTPTAGAYCALYLLPALPAASPVYVDGGGSTAPPAGTLVATFDLSTSATAKERAAWNIPVPPSLFKLVLLNSSGVTLASSGNTVSYALYSESDS